MLYTYNQDDEKIILFSLLLQKLMDGNKDYKKDVDNVIRDVKDLVIGRKNVYSINRNYFTTIIYLYKTDENFYANLDVNNLTVEEYSHIKKTLRNKNELTFV